MDGFTTACKWTPYRRTHCSNPTRMAQLGTISRHERSKRTRGIPLDSLLLAALSRQLHTNYYAKLLCLYPRNTRRVPTTCSRSSQDVTATMARRFALGVLASLYLAAPCFAQHPMNWEPCDGGLTQFVPSSVVLTPDPPVIGSPATFTISGTTGKSYAAEDMFKRCMIRPEREGFG